MNSRKYFLIALVVIILDQTSKLLVNHYMHIHEEVNVMGEWFKLHYLLNPGMAFGIKWQSDFGKLALTIFRIGAMFGIAWYLFRMSSKGAHTGFLVCMALILGGAVGNVIDSTFYGVLLHNQPHDAVTPWFHGQVIDMLFFPIFDFVWPDWVPVVGGDNFLFFSPVFNLADSSIFIGVVTILIFQKRFFKEHHDLILESQEVNNAAVSEINLEVSQNNIEPTTELKSGTEENTPPTQSSVNG